MILITGGYGQLGQDIVKVCQQRGFPYLQTSQEDLDITNPESVKAVFTRHDIDAVIHCAAYTAVDQAEDQADLCFLINKDGTENLALAAKEANAKFLYISTDYVFDGNKQGFYETHDTINPMGVYAKSKADGEWVVQKLLDRYFIVRISWVFGLHGKNFIRTMLRIGKEKDIVNVVSDQVGSPTYTVDVANTILDLVATESYGIFHATNEGFCSWANLAQYVFKAAGFSTRVNPILTKDYPTKAKRPQNSCLSKQSLLNAGIDLLPPWQDAVDRFILELKGQGEL